MSVIEDRSENDDIADVDFDEKYEIKRCADWINTNRHRKICLQFPDELLCDAVGVKSQLQIYTDAELYVSADATFRSCCLDFKTAKHADADALIHFGRICSSRFQSNSTASLLVLPKEFLNVDALIECVTSFVEQKRCNIVLLYDIAFAHYANQLHCRLSTFRSNISLSQVLGADNQVCDATNAPHCRAASVMTDVASSTIVKKFGRQYRVDFSDCDRMLVYVYIISANSRRNFENFLLSSPESLFYTYDSRADSLLQQCVPKTIKKTLFRVEKVKQARRIGILVATLEAHSFLDAVRRIKKLCAVKKKKTYIISVGKLNVAKLANFPEIDLFVMISCPEVEIIDRKEYFQTIVSAMELELALNDNHRWMGKFVADFSEFLPGGSEYAPVNEYGPNSQEASYADVSLLNNRMIGFDNDDGCDRRGSAVIVVPSCNAVSTVIDNSKYHLANRSWTGLQMQIADENPVSTVTVGRKGTPAAGYETPFSDHVA